MSTTLAAWLAAASGLATGAIAARLRHRQPSRPAVVSAALLGALCSLLGYGAFLAVGAVLSLVFFSGPPDAWPALLCSLLGCAAFLLLAWLQSVLGLRIEPRPRRSGRVAPGEILDARGGTATMWLAGVGLALLPAIYGMQCLVTRKGTVGTLLWHATVEGGGAIALGLGWIGVAALLHFHFFFGLHPRLEAHSRTGKLYALIAACVGLSTAGIWSFVANAPR